MTTPSQPSPEAPVRVGLTIGDPGGVGPELILRALAEIDAARTLTDCEFHLVGPRSLWRFHAELLLQSLPSLEEPVQRILSEFPLTSTADPRPDEPPEIGRTGARHGQVAEAAIGEAVRRCVSADLDAMVTGPINKEGLRAGGSAYHGHTEMIRDLSGARDVAMMLAGGGLRVGLVTIHEPLRRIFDLITTDLILAKARIMHAFLQLWLDRIPRIAVCGLNPHAGEGGLFGSEDQEIIAPAIEAARHEGLDLTGPHPPDTVFLDALHGDADGVLAMYHDQGLIAVKTLAFDEGVNLSMGLPIIRTSPDHGTAFNLAGTGRARPSSTRAAIAAAVDLAKRKRARRA